MAETRAVFDVTAKNFQAEVVERSRQLPVVVLFWADQLPPAKDARRVLETLAAQYQGKFALALSDVSRDQQLAQSLRVQGLPSIRVIQDGQLVDQMEGPQGERALRAMLDRLTMSSGDLLRADLDGVLASGDYPTALAMLKQALAAEPNNPAFKLEYADVLVRTGDLDEARTALASVPEGTEGRDRPLTRLQMMEEAAGMSEQPEIEAGLAKNPDDLELSGGDQGSGYRPIRGGARSRDAHPANEPQIPRRHRPHHAGPHLCAAAEGLRSGEKLSAPYVCPDALTDYCPTCRWAVSHDYVEAHSNLRVSTASQYGDGRSLSFEIDRSNSGGCTAWKLGN
jgi:putative thioredoxin